MADTRELNNEMHVLVPEVEMSAPTTISSNSDVANFRANNLSVEAPQNQSRLRKSTRLSKKIDAVTGKIVSKAYLEKRLNLSKSKIKNLKKGNNKMKQGQSSATCSVNNSRNPTPGTSRGNQPTCVKVVLDLHTSLFQDFEEATVDSIEPMPHSNAFPVMADHQMENNENFYYNNNIVYCPVCHVTGEILIVCDHEHCFKAFHLNCHAPALLEIPMVDWTCIYHLEVDGIDAFDGDDSEFLNFSNEQQFMKACKFLMDFYLVKETPTVRWVFPAGYLAKYGKVPCHLKYIHERLTLRRPRPFNDAREMLTAFRQMFIQAFAFYKKREPATHETVARTCFEKFMLLVDQYYPRYRDLLDGI